MKRLHLLILRLEIDCLRPAGDPGLGSMMMGESPAGSREAVSQP